MKAQITSALYAILNVVNGCGLTPQNKGDLRNRILNLIAEIKLSIQRDIRKRTNAGKPNSALVQTIIDWYRCGVLGTATRYFVHLKYRDNSYWFGMVSPERWKQIKQEEEQFDFDKVNVPVDYCDTCVGKPDDICSDCAKCSHQCECEKQSHLILGTLSYTRFTYLHITPVDYGLCAWCRRFWRRSTGFQCSPRLTDEQFEITRQGETSHGICPCCAKALKAEDLKRPPTFSINAPVRVVNVYEDCDHYYVGRCGNVVGIVNEGADDPVTILYMVNLIGALGVGDKVVGFYFDELRML